MGAVTVFGLTGCSAIADADPDTGSLGGSGSGDVFAAVETIGDGVEVVGHGSCGFDVEDPAKSVAGSSGVAVGDRGGAQVPVLQRERAATAGQAGDVPGEDSPEAVDMNRAVRILGDAFIVRAA